ncbi:hypothetical protein F4604DRAFT_1686570 [Suillus subluteus]|nr:hypothetical protein F4604DRAFT_1686570 [Suillus subluteus]
MPAYSEIFSELTIFSHELGETVTIAYPVNRATGERIISHNLKDWTQRRNIAWECFCGLLTEHCTPVRFNTNRHGHAMAYCHQSPSECGFSLYLNHPWLVNLRDLVLEHAQLFPYFEGYCGTPISALAPSQRGGTVRNIASYRRRPISALNMRQQRITHYIRRQPAPPVDELASLSLTEQNTLRSLADGKVTGVLLLGADLLRNSNRALITLTGRGDYVWCMLLVFVTQLKV